MTKTAVVLFNLGGPDSLEAVRPFLFNLFHDPAIIRLPKALRWFLAKMISTRRAPVAREIYEQLGGASPLLENTRAQAEALAAELESRWADRDRQARVFLSMRYWHPRSDEAARAVRDFDPDEVVLLPLYPQYSTTTSASSLTDWHDAAAKVSLAKPTWTSCCYPDLSGFVGEIAERLSLALEEAAKVGRPRILFSAHGLPERVIQAGDPYQWQVERTAAAVVEALEALRPDADRPDWLVCYQSRVGRMKWIEPYTDAEIARGGRERIPLVVVPIAFVSEHSETLVELDLEYRHLAEEAGVPLYLRVGTVDTGAAFISGLADLATDLLEGEPRICSATGGRVCPSRWSGCALAGGR